MFVLDRARQEAERVEANGIADYQQKIKAGLNPQIIEWQGREATEKLADSPNSKIMVIGSGKGGLPVIFNSGATPGPQTAAWAAAL